MIRNRSANICPWVHLCSLNKFGSADVWSLSESVSELENLGPFWQEKLWVQTGGCTPVRCRHRTFIQFCSDHCLDETNGYTWSMGHSSQEACFLNLATKLRGGLGWYSFLSGYLAPAWGQLNHLGWQWPVLEDDICFWRPRLWIGKQRFAPNTILPTPVIFCHAYYFFKIRFWHSCFQRKIG